MTQEERLHYLIQHLLNEDSQYKDISIPNSEKDKKRLLTLIGVRQPL